MINKTSTSHTQVQSNKKLYLLTDPKKSRNKTHSVHSNLLTEQKNITTYDDSYFLPNQNWQPGSTLSQFQGNNPKVFIPMKRSKSKNIGYFRNILNFSKNLLLTYRDNNTFENRLNKNIKNISKKTPLLLNLPKLEINTDNTTQFTTTNKDSIQDDINKTTETIKTSPRIEMNVFDEYYNNIAAYESVSSFRACPTHSTYCKTSLGNKTLSLRSKLFYEDCDAKVPKENKRKAKRDLINNLLFGKNDNKPNKTKSNAIKIINNDDTNNQINSKEEYYNVNDNFNYPKNGVNYKLPNSYKKTKTKLDNEIASLVIKAKNAQEKQSFIITKNLANYGNDIIEKIKIVNAYLSLQKESLFIPSKPRHKIVFVIVDGTVVLSTKHIPGVFIEIPTQRSLSFLNTKKERLEKFYAFLDECKTKLKLQVRLTSVFLVTSVPIFDLIDIPEQDMCVYVSSNSIFHGVHLFNDKNKSKRQIMKSLNEKEINLLQFKPTTKQHKEKFDLAKFIKKRKRKKILEIDNEKRLARFKKIKKQKPKYLNEQSFTFRPDDSDVEKEEWKYLSDEETRKKKLELFFKNYYDSKTQACVYIWNTQMNEQIAELRKNQKLKINKFIKQRPNEKTKLGLSKLISIYNSIRLRKRNTFCKNKLKYKNLDEDESNQETKEIHENATQVMKLFIEKMKIFRKHDKTDIDYNTNLFYKKGKRINNNNNKYIISNVQETMDMVFHADYKTDKYYPDLVSYHIPNLLIEFPKLKRREVYEVFADFKTLLKICISINKKLSLLKEGIDFETFFNCNLQINSQGNALAKKIFNAINTLNSLYINWDEYMKGLLTLKNKDLNDKLDLFLHIIDEDGNGKLSFKEVYSLSLESLSRNLHKKETEENDENDIVKILADYFARLIFELVGKPITEEIPIDVIKKKICEGGKAAEYLEMFICADNFT